VALVLDYGRFQESFTQSHSFALLMGRVCRSSVNKQNQINFLANPKGIALVQLISLLPKGYQY
jgi:hypothetical protein